MSISVGFIFLLCILTVISISATLLQSTGQEYNQRNYLPTGTLLMQFAAKSKILCAAQCARLVSTCNIAVFNPILTISCLLYSESLTMGNLVPASKAITIDFGRIIYSGGCVLSAGMNALATYSIITVGNLQINSDVYSRSIICGSILSSSSVNFIKGIDPNAYPVARYGLEIHGSIGSGSVVKVYAGSLGLSTNLSRTITPLTSKDYIVDGRFVSIEEGARGASVNISPNLTNKCLTIKNGIQTLSNQMVTLMNLPANNISIPTGSVAPLIFYVNAVNTDGIATFYINGNTALNNTLTQRIEIIVSINISSILELIVINLLGTNIVYSNGNMEGTWLTSNDGCAKTIWNFNQATSITLTAKWRGTLLAPYASVSTDSEMNGVFAVRDLTTTTKVNDPLVNLPSCV